MTTNTPCTEAWDAWGRPTPQSVGMRITDLASGQTERGTRFITFKVNGNAYPNGTSYWAGKRVDFKLPKFIWDHGCPLLTQEEEQVLKAWYRLAS